MRKRTPTLTLELPTTALDTDCVLEIDVEVQPPWRGSRERGTGIQLEPDEPAGVEIVGARVIRWGSNPEIELAAPLPIEDWSALNVDEIERRVLELVADDDSGRGDYEYDSRREASL